MKKAIFFDGDGTLWYPRSTLRTVKPHWVYTDPGISDPYKEFIVTPTTIETLEELGKWGIKQILLSTSPLSTEEAIISRINAVKQIDIHHLLDDIQVSPDRVEGKGERIVQLLGEYGLQPADALMVGDTYLWDYDSACKAGIDAMLIRSDYQKEQINQFSPHLIEEVGDILTQI